jgi:hypothetical protein
MVEVGIDSSSADLYKLVLNYLNSVSGYKNIDLTEILLEPLFKVLEEPLRGAIIARNDFNCDDVVQELDATILPSALIGRCKGTYRDRAKPGHEI